MKKVTHLRLVSLTVSPQAEDAASELMWRVLGQPASSYQVADLGTSVVSVYLEKESQWTPARRKELAEGLKLLVECGLDVGPGKIASRKVKNEEWAESWKKHFKPLEIGRKLLIKPSWSRKQARKGQHEVILDPGMAFGTGQHPTTSFCLDQLADVRVEGEAQSFLDLGTGTGILAICAAKLGYEPIDAIDYDPDSVEVTKENAEANGVGDLMDVRQQDLTKAGLKARRRYHVVCANLIYDLLLAEQQRILNRCRPGGVLILAGILTSQYSRVRDAYVGAGCEERDSRTEGEWTSGSFLIP